MKFQQLIPAHPELQYIFCGSHSPTSEDFNRDLTGKAQKFNVLLEVWGEIEHRDAMLSYTAIPIRHYEYFENNRQDITGSYSARYSIYNEPPDPRVAPLEGMVELEALAKVALGIRYSEGWCRQKRSRQEGRLQQG